MTWVVTVVNKAQKQYKALPNLVRKIFITLLKEIEILGPVRGNWKNYSKLPNGGHHCHLKGRKPTYVACWREAGKKKIEVYYVGTHEKAPY